MFAPYSQVQQDVSQPLVNSRRNVPGKSHAVAMGHSDETFGHPRLGQYISYILSRMWL